MLYYFLMLTLFCSSLTSYSHFFIPRAVLKQYFLFFFHAFFFTYSVLKPRFFFLSLRFPNNALFQFSMLSVFISSSGFQSSLFPFSYTRAGLKQRSLSIFHAFFSMYSSCSQNVALSFFYPFLERFSNNPLFLVFMLSFSRTQAVFKLRSFLFFAIHRAVFKQRSLSVFHAFFFTYSSGSQTSLFPFFSAPSGF